MSHVVPTSSRTPRKAARGLAPHRRLPAPGQPAGEPTLYQVVATWGNVSRVFAPCLRQLLVKLRKRPPEDWRPTVGCQSPGSLPVNQLITKLWQRGEISPECSRHVCVNFESNSAKGRQRTGDPL
jgi:hypothetical protein